MPYASLLNPPPTEAESSNPFVDRLRALFRGAQTLVLGNPPDSADPAPGLLGSVPGGGILASQLPRALRPVLPMVQKMARKFARSRDQVEDLVQTGMLAAIEAEKDFDASKGAAFTTWAWQKARAAMSNLSREELPVRLPKEQTRPLAKVAQAEQEIAQSAKGQPGPLLRKAKARSMGMTEEQYERARTNRLGRVELDRPVMGSEETVGARSRIPGLQTSPPSPGQPVDIDQMTKAMSFLSPGHQAALRGETTHLGPVAHAKLRREAMAELRNRLGIKGFEGLGD